ncbi:hypothetical protein [Thermodesulfatator autotrophicus]|uniref:Uncharacterized protein n=1 Tax=Thermodesulfatator autotrophicus TaxID=1795632 RepID=A0A177E6H4_9BACT|nr:hypothetical protein [Thermodesulfatator autotrophicus]OAG27547.1 hypothetical protein TH606_06570 [Thermodesulfatator autotrophicus]
MKSLRRVIDRALDAVERKVVSTVDRVAAEDLRRGLEERRRMSPEEIEEEDILFSPFYAYHPMNIFHSDYDED